MKNATSRRERHVERRRALRRGPGDAAADASPDERDQAEQDHPVERHQQVALLAAERDRDPDRQRDPQQHEPDRGPGQDHPDADHDDRDGHDHGDDRRRRGQRRGEAVEAIAGVVLGHQRPEQHGPRGDEHRQGAGALALAAQPRQRQQQRQHGEGGGAGGDLAGGLVHGDPRRGTSAALSPSSVRATSQRAEGLMRGGTLTRTVPAGPRAPPPTCAPSGSPRVSPGVPVRR